MDTTFEENAEQACMNTPLKQADQGLALISERFPDIGQQVVELVRRDQRFRDICEDYFIARAALTNFERSPNQESEQVVADYKQLVTELEAEILELLKSCETGEQGR